MPRVKKEPKNYELAPAVRKLAHKLRSQHFPGLTDAVIEAVFGTECQKEAGVDMPAKTSVIRGRQAWLAYNLVTESDQGSDPDPFFLIEVHKGWWESVPDLQKEALLFNELCKMAVKASGTLSKNAYDVQEFHACVKKYGPWRKGIAEFFAIQPGLPLGTDAEAEAPAPKPPKAKPTAKQKPVLLQGAGIEA